MPVIARFFGIIIKMYFSQREWCDRWGAANPVRSSDGLRLAPPECQVDTSWWSSGRRQQKATNLAGGWQSAFLFLYAI